MSFDLDPIYVIYLFVAVSAGLFVEGLYLLVFSGASYRKNVNRRLKLLKDQNDRESILVQLRKERGLTGAGNYKLGIEWFNSLVLQSGLTVGIGKLLTYIGIGASLAFVVTLFWRHSVLKRRWHS
jgi:tight adherence protein B